MPGRFTCAGIAGAAALAALFPLPAAVAKEPASAAKISLSPPQMLEAARTLLARDALDEAEVMLAALAKAPDTEYDLNQALFLKGMIVARRGHPGKAAGIFKTVLAEKPDAALVRYEYARARFAQKRDREAAKHYRLALKSDLPVPVKKQILDDLKEIDDRRIFRTSFNASIAPNTNINAGAGSDLGNYFFGGFIPFDVADAPPESGTGLSASGSVLMRNRLTPRWRIETEFGTRITDYSRSLFDDGLVFAATGPVYRFDNAEVKLAATASLRQFGGEDYYEKTGARLSLTTPLAWRTQLSLSAGFDNNSYKGQPARDGYGWTLGSSLSHLNGSATRRLGFRFNYSREEPGALPESALERNHQYSLGLSVEQKLPKGFTLQVAPEIFYKRYDACNPTDFHLIICQSPDKKFRTDVAPSLTLGITKSDWSLFGFSPSVSYNYLDYGSNVARYSYDRHTIDFGLRRSF